MLVPIRTTTEYGHDEEKFEAYLDDGDTIRAIITDEPTRKLNYQQIRDDTLDDEFALAALHIGPDFDDGEIFDILYGQDRASLMICVPKYMDQAKAMKINERLVNIHFRYLERLRTPYAVK